MEQSKAGKKRPTRRVDRRMDSAMYQSGARKWKHSLTYSPGQVASLIGMAHATVTGWIRTRRLRAFRLPDRRATVIRHEDLEAFLESQPAFRDALMVLRRDTPFPTDSATPSSPCSAP